MRVLRSTGGIEEEMLYGGAIIPEKGVFLYVKIPEGLPFFPGKDIALISLYNKELYALFNLIKEPGTDELKDFFDVLDDVYILINDNLVELGSEDNVSGTLKQLFDASGIRSTAKGTITKKRIRNGDLKGMSYYTIE